MSDSTPPLRLSNETNVRMPLYLLLGLLVVCCGGALAWANVSGQVSEIPAMKSRLDAHDAALADVRVMANDIKWIRKIMSEPRTTTTVTTSRIQPLPPGEP